MSIWWSLHLPCEAASVPFARRLLLGAMESAGVDPDVSHDLSVALSEACANAVEHGGDPACGERPEVYQVTAYLDGETCRIEVADWGPGFAAERPRPAFRTVHADAEHGRGLGLIRELADHVHIGNTPDRGGAVVSFDKILKWVDGAPAVAV
ncbi:ATP-binding protein [Streptomyces sp. RY43-2]|uniref:ATP-binding protein n=1 Tax=Streptomyces macrolidinus TaxID=2952607 RepID=A0ABT0ZHQ2_9ACTN|nr:ATP-binding protein [Streptomyces macrolidinus]MCN9243124.1 ATP-binding protein [Streptomyces macrolidinus]